MTALMSPLVTKYVCVICARASTAPMSQNMVLATFRQFHTSFCLPMMRSATSASPTFSNPTWESTCCWTRSVRSPSFARYALR